METEEEKWLRAASLAQAIQLSIADAQQAGLKLDAATMVRAVVLQLYWSRLRYGGPDAEELEELFKDCAASGPGQMLLASLHRGAH